MKRILLFGGLVAVAVGVLWVSIAGRVPKTEAGEPAILSPDQYSAAAGILARDINEISPTPPTESSWKVREVEFVPKSSYAYVIYHDTHNIFRLLLRTERYPDEKLVPSGDYQFRVAATFERGESGWITTHGEDAVSGQKGVVYIYDLKAQTWVERP